MNIEEIDRQCPRTFNNDKMSKWEWKNTPFNETCLNVIIYTNYNNKFESLITSYKHLYSKQTHLLLIYIFYYKFSIKFPI